MGEMKHVCSAYVIKTSVSFGKTSVSFLKNNIN